jgi:ABC-type dipeptide/oligopeptide/nickel transport system permease component
MGRRVLELVFTLVAASAITHVFFATTLSGQGLATGIADTPSGLADRFVHGRFGATEGGGCNQHDDYHPLCSVPFGDDPLQYLKAMWTPWLLVALPLAALVLRITEATLREDLQEDYVIAAMIGVNVGTLLLTVAVLEYSFSIPGMFRVINTAAMQRDVPVLEGIVIEGVVLITLANFLVDAIQARLDPRV